tara:strand:+ start:3555 stop:4502 length:948 start_codon:yes stop_codon:yes gene_type:complete
VASHIIELSGLTKKYGDFVAVDKLDLKIPKGEIFGLLGPNGAGKSTTILMLLGLTEPTSGSVKVCGINSTREPVEVKKKVGYLPENLGFYDDRSGLDNLIYTARLNQIPEQEAKEKAKMLLQRVGLTDQNKKTGTYSRGMRQRLGLADVLIKSPEVIILDEPTLGIDPKGVQELLQLIKQLSKEDGLTVLLSSHHLHQVQKVCDRVGLFVNGKLIAEGDVASLSAQLFGREPITIEARVIEHDKSKKDVEKAIKKVKNVKAVQKNQDTMLIDCTEDVTNEIAQAIIESGLGLSQLYRREYGLDDIYQRYFEKSQV